MKRLAAVLIILLGLFPGVPVADAQELKFSIANDIEADPFDMTAREVNRNDGDGYAYAIIKVTSDIEDDDLSKFDFSFGYIKSEEELHDGELWIFVARGVKTVDIRREGYKPILKHQFRAIREGTTYTMKLSVQTPKVKHRVLQFKVEPAGENAIVKVKPESGQGGYDLWGTVDETGSINRFLETGTYLYEVTADNYESSQGRVVLTASDSGDNFVENVRLTPNFGYLEIVNDHDIAGAEVYVNDRKVGTVPYVSDRMECRDDYRLMISKGELYKTYSATFANYRSERRDVEILKDETTQLEVKLSKNADAADKLPADGVPSLSPVVDGFDNGHANGHEYVDLGLSSGTLWATCNVGATSPEEYGSYFAWGETETKSSYTSSNYGYSSNPTTLPADRDAARANWGGSWSMPTAADFKELYSECTWTWTTMNGKNGYKVSSKKNSSYIFLAAASVFGSSLSIAGSLGIYWSSSLDTSDTSYAFALYFSSSYVSPSDYGHRYGGRSVRPVLRK